MCLLLEFCCLRVRLYICLMLRLNIELCCSLQCLVAVSWSLVSVSFNPAFISVFCCLAGVSLLLPVAACLLLCHMCQMIDLKLGSLSG